MATTVDLDWKNLSFGYLKTDYNIRSYFRNGAWTTPEMTSDETVNLHMAATGLHYGQEAFEGLKAFRGVDGQRTANALRLRPNTCAWRCPRSNCSSIWSSRW